MKTKLTKKMLSLFLAVLMVISALPFTAVTASAASGTIANSGHTVLVAGDESRWGSDQMNIVNDQEAKNTSAGVLKFDVSTLASLYYYNNFSSITLNYTVDSYSADSGIGGIKFYYSSSIKDDTWYINNGEVKNTGWSTGSGTTANTSFSSAMGFDLNNTVGTLSKAGSGSFDISNIIKNFADSGEKTLYIIIMASQAGGKGNSGGWSDTKIKPSSVSINYNYSDMTLEQLMDAYKVRMSTGVVYYNMSDAYNAYLDACEALDAKNYGDDTTVNLDAVRTNLYNALIKMTVYNGAVNTTKGNYYNTEAVSNGYYSYHNVLWSQSGNANVSGGSGTEAYVTNSNAEFKYILPSAVLLYGKDGAKAGAPIIFEFGATSSIGLSRRTLNMKYVKMSSTALLNFQHKWYASTYTNDTYGSWNEWNDRFNPVNKVMEVGYLGTESKSTYYCLGSEQRFMANEICFNSSTFEDNNGWSSSAVGDEIKLTVHDNNKELTMYNKDAKIYTINYKKLYDIVVTKDTIKTDLKKVTDVNNNIDSIVAFLSKLDSVTSFQPMDYFSSASNSNLGTNVTNCANAVKSKYDEINGYTATIGKSSKDYQSLRDAITNTRNTQNSDSYCSGKWNNFQTALSNAKQAMRDVVNISYTDANAGTLAQTLTDAKNSLGGHDSVSSNNAVAATCTTEGKDSDTKCSVCGVTLTTGATINALGHEWGNYVEVGSTYHSRYCSRCKTWEPYENEEHKHDSKKVTKEAVEATCTTVGKTAELSCSVCGRVMQQQTPTQASLHSITSKIEGNKIIRGCSTCDTQNEEIDIEAYNGAKAQLEAEIAKTDKYVSVESMQNALTANALDVNNDTDDTIESKITAMLSAITSAGDESNIQSYTLQFNYFDGIENQYETHTVKYGSLVNISIPADVASKSFAYKWVESDNDADIEFATVTNKTSVVVTKNTKVVAYIAEVKDELEETDVRVNLYDNSNRLIAVGYTSASSITFTDTTVELGTTTLKPTRIPFYTANGFKIGDEMYSSSKSTYTIPDGTKTVNIKTNYTTQSKIIINAPENVTLNGAAVSSYYEAVWNEKIVLKADSEVAWYTGDTLLATGSTFTFRANADIVITTKEIPSQATPTTSIGYFDYDVSLNRVTAINNFYAPNATEAGVILSTKYSTVDDIKKNGQKFVVESEYFTSDKNQARVSVTRRATTKFTMYAISYVVVGGQTYFSDSVATCSYAGIQ